MTERDEQQTRQFLTAWVNELATELDATEAPVDIDEILAIAGTAAHAVLRPAAPLTTYLLGYVAGRAAGDAQAAFDAAAAVVRRRASQRDSGPAE